MEKLTPAQQRAVAARGNVLVMAGAGTGKTRTLIERGLNLIRDEQVSLEEILIVTFTEAAAAEMKQRLRSALENALKSQSSNPDPFCAEQLALFDAAPIGTLHSFCFRLVREHFHELALDPQFAILSEDEARLLADETLDEQFRLHYENNDPFSLAAQDLITIYGQGRDEKIRRLVLRIYNYAQTRPDAGGWLREQIENFSQPEPVLGRAWLSEAISHWREEWMPLLKDLRDENSKAGECFGLLQQFKSPEVFQKILAADGKENFPKGKWGKLREPLSAFFSDAKFLNTFATTPGDALAEDWNWTGGRMKTLLLLAREFSEAFSARKLTDGVLDFHDLEQFTLKLLWDFKTQTPTEIAGRWRQKLRFIFVDEYQDINAAQDKIISAISGEGGRANRFLVGDVKQSIYRFRLADPKIFRDYAAKWRGKNGQTLPLTENFRSRESLLNFVNSIFRLLMREEIGDVNYDDEARLKFGSPNAPDRASLAANGSPHAELLLQIKTDGNDEPHPVENDELTDLQASEKEARALALRFSELKRSGHEIRDGNQFRAADWRDMAVLLRAPSGKADIFAREFERIGVPLLVERGGFYDSSEVLDLLGLLQMLDNPLQDIPCIAILRSPLVGCSLDELAEIRAAGSGRRFWTALNQARKPASKIQNQTRKKIERFLERFSRWRKSARQSSFSQCLEDVLSETFYDDWLQAQPRGAQRRANVERFLNLTQRFDQFQRQGLFRFLKFIDAQREAEMEPEVAPAAKENTVRLMSIHQSKGLEFPIVAIADLSKRFNEQDFHGDIILDEKYGLCPRVKPPGCGGHYSSLSHWLAQKKQRRELRGEELRLLYVAMTRARDRLILTAGLSKKNWETNWQKSNTRVAPGDILSANSFADWLGLWFASNQVAARNESPLLSWRTVEDPELANKSEPPILPSTVDLSSLTASEKLRDVLNWAYPFGPATRESAKASVTLLRRRLEELNEEAEQKFAVHRRLEFGAPGPKMSATDTGTVTHKFLQHVSLDNVLDSNSLKGEVRRLENENYLTENECSILDLKGVLAFWNSPVGRQILAQSKWVRRELPFTAKFSPEELAAALGSEPPAGLANEFVVIQGVVDLVVALPKEMWILDFKTDGVSESDLPERTKLYEPQLKLYAQALEKIYLRPITNRWLHFLSARRTVKI